MDNKTTDESSTSEVTDTLEQQQNAMLRERFLRVLDFLEHKTIEIETYQGSSVSGMLRSIDYDITSLHMNNLMTPIGCVPEALIRTTDIVSLKYRVNELNE